MNSSTLNSFGGLYSLTVKNFRKGRPLYKHLEKEVFLFYRVDSNTWDIYRNPYSKSSYAYAEDITGCPPETGWKTIEASNWVDSNSLRVIEYSKENYSRDQNSVSRRFHVHYSAREQCSTSNQ